MILLSSQMIVKMAVKMAAALDLHSILSASPRCPRIDFIGSDPVTCSPLNQSLSSRIADVLTGHYGKQVTSTQFQGTGKEGRSPRKTSMFLPEHWGNRCWADKKL